MQRREFLMAGAVAAGSAWIGDRANGRDLSVFHDCGRFRLKYAPHFGMFKHSAGSDLTDQLKFAAEQGFTAWEDQGLKDRSVELRKKIAAAVDACGMELGALSAIESYEDVTFARKRSAQWEEILRELRRTIEVARRVGARWLSVVPGRRDETLPAATQMANCIELLKRCCDLVERAGLVLVLEPVGGRTGRDGCLLPSLARAHQVCRAMDRPSCKILLDCYHQSCSADDLIRGIELAWPDIAYVQSGDRPGRKEPGTGATGYDRVFRHLQGLGYRGIIGMEHGNSRPGAEGELAVIGAYAAVDPR